MSKLKESFKELGFNDIVIIIVILLLFFQAMEYRSGYIECMKEKEKDYELNYSIVNDINNINITLPIDLNQET